MAIHRHLWAANRQSSTGAPPSAASAAPVARFILRDRCGESLSAWEMRTGDGRATRTAPGRPRGRQLLRADEQSHAADVPAGDAPPAERAAVPAVQRALRWRWG